MFETLLAFAEASLETANENAAPYLTLQTIKIIAALLLIQNVSKNYQAWDTEKVKKQLLNNTLSTLQRLPTIGPKLKTYIDNKVKKELAGHAAEIMDKRKSGTPMEPILHMPKKPLSMDIIRARFALLQSEHKYGQLSGAVYVPKPQDQKTPVDEKANAETLKKPLDKYQASDLSFADVSEEKIGLFAMKIDTENKLNPAIFPPFFEVREQITGLTADTNPMHSAWPLINLMEAEVISWLQEKFHGESGAPGIMTHGGSTSILEACAMYVNAFRDNTPILPRIGEILGVRTLVPEIIIPETAHVAFDKAAKLLGAKLVRVLVDPVTKKADPKAMEKAITMNTCMMVASAPSFMDGAMDPVKELAAIAEKRNIPLHVDACLGGMLTAFTEQSQAFDFSIKGVSSISADTHKYGLAPKGSSVLLVSPNNTIVPTQVYLDWQGGMYVTPGIDGSRSGVPIATTWFTLAALGEEFYELQAKKIFALRQNIVKDLKSIHGIEVGYDPEHCVVGIRGDWIDKARTQKINLLLVADQFKKNGWEVNILQDPHQKADAFHFCFTLVHATTQSFEEKFIRDLKNAVQFAIANPKAPCGGMAKIYGKLELGIDLSWFKLPFPEAVKQQMGQQYQSNIMRLRVEADKGISKDDKAPKAAAPLCRLA